MFFPFDQLGKIHSDVALCRTIRYGNEKMAESLA